MTNKLQNTSSLMTIVDTINELVDVSDNNDSLLDSFRNEDNLTDDIYSYEQINQGYVIEIKTTGIYQISLQSTNGTTQVLVNAKNDTAYFRTQLNNANNMTEILLCHGDNVMITGDVEVGDSLNVKISKTIIQAFVEKTKELDNVLEMLNHTQSLITNYQVAKDELDSLIGALEHNMRVIVDTQRDIQNLSARVSQLEG